MKHDAMKNNDFKKIILEILEAIDYKDNREELARYLLKIQMRRQL
jgi:hypothetical protein